MKAVEGEVAGPGDHGDADGHAVLLPGDTTRDMVEPLAQVDALRAEPDAFDHRVASSSADLDALARIRDDLIATASHELKSPLTSILGGAQYVERLLARPLPEVEQAIAWTRVIQNQVRTMTLLIDSLLDASRVQTGAFDLRRAPCDLAECVATALGRLDPDLQARVTVTGPRHSVRGRWDRHRIEQVLANLLDNALKYSPEGAPVSVGVESRAEEVEVAVTDHGAGIPRDELPRLVERFYRAANARAGTAPGTGLGLYICNQIIAAHGGRLWAESAGPDQGSTFRFTLPRVPAGVAPGLPPEGQHR